MIQALYRKLREVMQKKETIEETRLSEVLCPIWNFPKNWSKDIIEAAERRDYRRLAEYIKM